MEIQFEKLVIQTSSIFYTECYPFQVFLVALSTAVNIYCLCKWPQVRCLEKEGDLATENFNWNDLTKTIRALWQKQGQTPVLRERLLHQIFFPFPGIPCLIHDCWLEVFHREVFCDRKCPFRKMKYFLGYRWTTEAKPVLLQLPTQNHTIFLPVWACWHLSAQLP